MQLTIRLLGTEVLHISTDAVDSNEGPGDCTTYPVGFAPSPGDQRWQEMPEVDT